MNTTDFQKVDPQALRPGKFRLKKGPPSIIPGRPLTNAEKQRRYRAKMGGRNINTSLKPDVAACFIYLRNEWGMKNNVEVMDAAVRFLALMTRSGLQRLPQSIDD